MPLKDAEETSGLFEITEREFGNKLLCYTAFFDISLLID